MDITEDHEIGAADAKTHFAQVLDRVEHHGEKITVTRHGRPIAEIRPAAAEVREEGPDPFIAHLLAIPKCEDFEPMPREDSGLRPVEL